MASKKIASFLEGFVPALIQTRQQTKEDKRRAELDQRMKDFYDRQLRAAEDKKMQEVALQQQMAALIQTIDPSIAQTWKQAGLGDMSKASMPVLEYMTKVAAIREEEQRVELERQQALAAMGSYVQSLGGTPISNATPEILEMQARDLTAMKHIAASRAPGGGSGREYEISEAQFSRQLDDLDLTPQQRMFILEGRKSKDPKMRETADRMISEAKPLPMRDPNQPTPMQAFGIGGQLLGQAMVRDPVTGKMVVVSQRDAELGSNIQDNALQGMGFISATPQEQRKKPSLADLPDVIVEK